MVKEMKKRLLSIVLCLAVCFSFLQLTVAADNPATGISPKDDADVVLLLDPQGAEAFNKRVYIELTPSDADDYESVQWESSDPDTVKIVTEDLVPSEKCAPLKALKLGTATVTATTAGGQTATFNVTVDTLKFTQQPVGGEADINGTLAVPYKTNGSEGDETGWSLDYIDMSDESVHTYRSGYADPEGSAELSPGTYKLRLYKNSENYAESDEFTVLPAAFHNLSVINGSPASSSIKNGDYTTISADVPAGKVFARWKLVSGNAFIDKPGDESTLVIMGSQDSEIKAVLYSNSYTYTHSALVGVPIDEKVFLDEYFEDCVSPAVVSIPDNTFGGSLNTTIANGTSDGRTYISLSSAEGSSAVSDPVVRDVNLNVDGAEVTLKLSLGAVNGYPITVVNGTGTLGDGSGKTTKDISQCAEGVTVTLKADAAPEGKKFDKWVVNKGDFSVTDPSSADGASFVTVTEEMEVEATYKDNIYPITVVNGVGILNGTGKTTETETECAPGITVTLSANPAPIGKAFDRWAVTEGTFNISTPTLADAASFTTVEEPMTVEAQYKTISYKITSGNNQTYTKDSGATLIIDCEGPYAYFKELLVDGKIVSPTGYSVRSNGTATRVILSNPFLQSLTNTTHRFMFVYEDGSGEPPIYAYSSQGQFTVRAANSVPSTGDHFNSYFYLALLALSGTGLALLAINRKKQRNH